MLDPYFEQIRRQGLAQRDSNSVPDIAAMRSGTARETEALGQGPELHSVRDDTIKTRSGKISVRVFSPLHPKGVVHFVHGGGWVIGRIDDFDSLARVLALKSQCIVLLPEYRLAPEYPYPSGLEDVIDSLPWAQEFAKSAALPLVGMGDSAGANLLLAAALEAPDSASFNHLFALYPVVDSNFEKPAYHQFGTGQLFTAAAMKMFFELYAPRSMWQDPTISILSHSNLHRLPGLTVLSCGCDLLKDDSTALIEACKKNGVSVAHIDCPSAPHGLLRHYAQSSLAAQLVDELTEKVHVQLSHLKSIM